MNILTAEICVRVLTPEDEVRDYGYKLYNGQNLDEDDFRSKITDNATVIASDWVNGFQDDTAFIAVTGITFDYEDCKYWFDEPC